MNSTRVTGFEQGLPYPTIPEYRTPEREVLDQGSYVLVSVYDRVASVYAYCPLGTRTFLNTSQEGGTPLYLAGRVQYMPSYRCWRVFLVVPGSPYLAQQQVAGSAAGWDEPQSLGQALEIIFNNVAQYAPAFSALPVYASLH